ncbi:MAG: hypothetical protein LBK68_06725 [Candidatus Margulisbacteria bacterium]|jgi:hypothetical protein|nr:hypothetical protein [Candidatus Margulisiibacteriota bacterium]
MTRIFQTKVESGERLVATDITDLTFFPIGMILMMDGSWTDGRGGWYICDGRDTPHGKTPDLTDRFIRGGGSSAGGTGGGSAFLSEANLPSHNHSLSGLTISGGDHLHGAGTLAVASGAATHSHGNGTLAVTITGGTHGHAITDPGHTHTVYNTYNAFNGSGLDGDNDSPRLPSFTNSTSSNSTTSITIANTTGSHEHGAIVSGAIANDSTAHSHGISGAIADADATHGHSITGNTASSTEHSHEISGGTISNTGSGTAFDVTPAYYTMIYIKKMA